MPSTPRRIGVGGAPKPPKNAADPGAFAGPAGLGWENPGTLVHLVDEQESSQSWLLKSRPMVRSRSRLFLALGYMPMVPKISLPVFTAVFHAEHRLLPGRGWGLRAVQMPVLLWQQVSSMLKSATSACM